MTTENVQARPRRPERQGAVGAAGSGCSSCHGRRLATVHHRRSASTRSSTVSRPGSRAADRPGPANGTEFGSLWCRSRSRSKEALLGFVLGALAGVVFGVALGQISSSPMYRTFIKVVNAIPRIVLGSIFIVALGFGTTSKVLLAAVLVFFVVFFNAFQGVREVDRTSSTTHGCSAPRRWRSSGMCCPVRTHLDHRHPAHRVRLRDRRRPRRRGPRRPGRAWPGDQTVQGNFDPNGVFAAMLPSP